MQQSMLYQFCAIALVTVVYSVGCVLFESLCLRFYTWNSLFLQIWPTPRVAKLVVRVVQDGVVIYIEYENEVLKYVYYYGIKIT